MKSILLVPPTTEPVTLAEAKQHCAVSHDEDDALLSVYLAGAREAVERHTGLYLSPQTWGVYTTLPGPLPFEPVVEVESVETVGAAGGLGPSVPFEFDAIDSVIRFDLVSGAARYFARVRVGYGEGLAPRAAKLAILLLVADLYDLRAANAAGISVTANPTVEFLLYPLRHNLGV